MGGVSGAQEWGDLLRISLAVGCSGLAVRASESQLTLGLLAPWVTSDKEQNLWASSAFICNIGVGAGQNHPDTSFQDSWMCDSASQTVFDKLTKTYEKGRGWGRGQFHNQFGKFWVEQRFGEWNGGLKKVCPSPNLQNLSL